MPKVLLRFPHGLGDVVQFTVVLKHLKKYRPDWAVDVQCGRGKHTALTGLCGHVFHDQEVPGPTGHYDTDAGLGWYENYCHYDDRPNSKVTNCLREVFGIDYDHSLGRYEIKVGAKARARALDYLFSVGCKENGRGKVNAVVCHYLGNTSPEKKNLHHWQAALVFDFVRRAGRVPVLLDWDKRSPLADGVKAHCPAPGPGDLWGGFGSGDAETIAALIGWAEAYVGVDSGPGKVASTTETPALICWTGHHPLQFHDPAPNTVHLVPRDHRRLPPVEGDRKRAEYFEAAYRWETYAGPNGLVAGVLDWLGRVLGCELLQPPGDPPFVTPQGIGDVVWALLKAKPLRQGKPVDVILAGDPSKEVCRRAVGFVKRFSFVRDVTVLDVPYLEDREKPADARGRYRYVPDGARDGFHFLMPNRALEDGKRLEEWLPDVPLDWSVIDDFSWKGTERGEELATALGRFVAFYLGPEAGNVDEGHNRGFLWEPRDWVALGKEFSRRGLKVAVVGATYDRSYYDRYVREGVQQEGVPWVDLIGKTEIGDCLAFLRRARCLVSYQCGLAIFAHYLGVPVVTWWRKDGDSAHPKYPVCFDDKMKDSWTKPDVVAAGKYMGLLYGNDTPWDVVAEIDKRGWLDT